MSHSVSLEAVTNVCNLDFGIVDIMASVCFGKVPIQIILFFRTPFLGFHLSFGLFASCVTEQEMFRFVLSFASDLFSSMLHGFSTPYLGKIAWYMAVPMEISQSLINSCCWNTISIPNLSFANHSKTSARYKFWRHVSILFWYFFGFHLNCFPCFLRTCSCDSFLLRSSDFQVLSRLFPEKRQFSLIYLLMCMDCALWIYSSKPCSQVDTINKGPQCQSIIKTIGMSHFNLAPPRTNRLDGELRLFHGTKEK